MALSPNKWAKTQRAILPVMMSKTNAKAEALAWLQIHGRQLALSLSGTEPWPAVMAEVTSQLRKHGDALDVEEVVVELGERPVPKYELASLAALLNRRGLRLRAVHCSSRTTQQSAAALSLYEEVPESSGNTKSSSAHYPGAQLPLIPEQAGLPALYIPGPVSSGRRVYSRGQLVVAGDVDAGAQLMAVGDILIWGRLMGGAHAGVDGDAQATVCALAFFAEQIHIGAYRIDSATYCDAVGPSELRVSAGRVELRSWPAGASI